MHPEPEPAASPADRPANPDDLITRETPCPGCGYNLRGLRYWQRCPECGGQAGGAAAGFMLLYSDPVWVRRLARGARWLGAAFVPWAAAIIFLHLILLGVDPSSDRFILLVTVLLVAAPLAPAWPLWLLTSPNPATRGRERRLSARILARIAGGVGLLGLGALVLLLFSRVPLNWGWGAALLLSPVGMSGPVLVVALSYYTEELGIWMADRRLGTRAAEFRSVFVTAWCGSVATALPAYVGVVIPCVCIFIPTALAALILATLILFLTAPLAGQLESIAARARGLRDPNAADAR